MGKIETKRLLSLDVSSVFKIGQWEFIVLEQLGDATIVVSKDVISERKEFGGSNNYDGSNVDTWCCSFADSLAQIIGKANIFPHIVDLTALNGLTCYGQIKRQVSIMTIEDVRMYIETLLNHPTSTHYWLATACGTSKSKDRYRVLCVSPRGFINYDNSYYNNFGVRPFCILNSNIFVSC